MKGGTDYLKPVVAGNETDIELAKNGADGT
jgi:hypothetical protein